MTTDGKEDICKLTFAQREEEAPLPEAMELEHVPQKFHQLVWLSIDKESGDLAGIGVLNDYYETRHIHGISRIIWSFKFDIRLIPHDEIPHPKPSIDRQFSREVVLHGQYHEVITFVEYILRHEECSCGLCHAIEHAFERTSTAYFVEKIGDIPTIMPWISRETGEATRRAIDTLDSGSMDGATTHLRQAMEHINSGQHADSIADSIHAVESVACAIDPRANKTLGPALDSLVKAGVLKHHALKEAFKKLYGYTSDEEGVRHALVLKGAADVGLDEAVFMFGACFGACASFAAYLIQKHRQTGENRAGGA